MSDILSVSQPKLPQIKSIDFFPVIFRYVVLVVIFFLIFFFFKDKSTQFILFIVVFIVNFFTIVFLYRDLLATNLVSSFFDPAMTFNLQESKSIFVKIFIGAIFTTLLLQVASIAIMLVVFDYGKGSTNNYYTPVMTDQNTNLLNEYIAWLKWYFIIIGVFAYVMAVSYTRNEKIRNIIINLGCLLPAGFLLGSSIYGTILAVKFLDNKKYHRALYK
jgi:uncharacterized oligopeptide transporter (OPT) family protein